MPAALVVAAAALALLGWAPRRVPLAWALVVGSVVLSLLGDLLGLPAWVQDVSPFTHVPRTPLAGGDALPVVLLLGVAAALTAAAVVGFRRRDLIG